MKTWHEVIKTVGIILAVLIVVGIVSAIIHLSSVALPILSGDAVGEVKQYEAENEIAVLDIDVRAVRLEVVSTPEANLLVESNYKHLSVEEKGEELLIKDKWKHFANLHEKAVVTIYIPEDLVFETVEINTGAGKVDVERLAAEELNMEFGAGEVQLENIQASERADINGGVGKLTIRNGEFQDLDLEMGVGELVFQGRLLGTNDLEFGVGSGKVNLTGSPEDYKIRVEKGLGAITVDGEDLQSGAVFGEGDQSVFIEGGVGSIRVNFED